MQGGLHIVSAIVATYRLVFYHMTATTSYLLHIKETRILTQNIYWSTPNILRGILTKT